MIFSSFMNPMRVTISFILMLVAAGPLSAQNSASNSDVSSVQLSSSELQKLVGPIALYSDPLLALILSASTYPDEITQANNYLNGGGTQEGIAQQNWEKSVQGLAHYPDVLHMMASNMDWTNQLGAAVLNQQSDVKAAVQAMRLKAQNLGNLSSNSQQKVTTNNGNIEITPANPQTVYVPTYNPDVVYVQQAAVGAAPLVTFGAGFALGAWCDFGCNWGWSGGFICSGGYYSSSYGWSSYSSWSSHHSWHHDWHHGGPYHHHGEWNHHDHNGDHGHDNHHDHDGGHGHDNDHGHHGEHPDQHGDRQRSDDNHRSENAHRHNSKENHDREHRQEHHAHPEHHSHPHHAAHHAAHHGGGHHGGGGHRR